MRETFEHVPVMLAEVLELFAPLPGGVLLDATVGGGGHARALLAAHPGFALVGIDQDPAAIEAARASLEPFAGRTVLRRARFDELAAILAEELRGRPLVGALFDLGVSSHQLDVAARGFSYRGDGPLDMRMDPDAAVSAADLVNDSSEDALAALFARNGEGRFARRIARTIIARRPIHTTGELASAVSDSIPQAARRRGHPARRVFQALRVEVNEELEVLGPALDAAIGALSPGGRLVVLAYHSGEDQLVKSHFSKAATGGCICPPGLPCVCGAVASVRLLNRGARLARAEEIGVNPRAEAARLRALERLDVPNDQEVR